MKQIIRGLLLTAFLSLAAIPVAHCEENPAPAVADLYWLGGEDVSYDSNHGALIPLQENRPGLTPLPIISLLPKAIPAPYGRPLIAIVIDDMGVDQKRSERAVRNLKPQVTLSYLAYAPRIRAQVASAKKQGHEIFLHLPWEPDSAHADPGPHHLSVDMPKEQLQQNLLANLGGFDGYVGVNNHMGSKFSRYRAGLETVMAELKKRGVFFLDSRTTPDSIAEKVALEYDIPATRREVFLDHVEKPEFVAAALREVESVALQKGSAVAIGHPKDMTLDALEAWLPTLEAKGFQLAPVTTVIKYRRSAADAYVAHLEADKIKK
ncbi:MAG: divergent polysaccharide deacetylase family protein [Alphaproteobacteria bacterium]|nr:divergent polysaccharide deacetylase family protein [Alphaproteobacteria bacterium]